MAKHLGVIGNIVKDKRDAKVRATLKGAEIAKLGPKPRRNVRFSGADYDIEIVAFNPIEGGVEVFARAWDEKGQIGFGKDGSVDIERFRIFNPPILVADGTQTLTEDSEGNPRLVDNFKEDAEEAILQSLAHTIKVKKEKHGSERIVPDTVGNTTSTFYPDADPETTSVDGPIENIQSGGVSWATIHDATAGTAANPGSSLAPVFRIQSYSSSPNWRDLERAFYLFDTSALPDSDEISAATLSIHGYGKADNLSITPNLNIYSSSPASNTNLVTGDYDQVGTTAFATAIAYGSLSTAGYNNFALNASGIAAISTTGVSKFSARNGNYDADNVAPTHPGSQTDSYFQGYYAEETGTSKDPKLVVEHSAPSYPITLTETSTWTDTFIKSLSRTISEASSWTDVLLVGVVRSLTLTDGSTWTDVFAYVVGRGKTLLETSTWTDVFNRIVTRVYVEASTWTDVIVRAKIALKTLTDASTWTDVFTSVKGANRTLTETVTWTDRLRLFLNGFTTGIWSRTSKPTNQNSWSKTDKPDT